MDASRLETSKPPVDAAQPSLLSAIFRRRKAVVLGTALVLASVTGAFAARQTKLYAATASVAVQSPLGQSAADAPNMATEQQRADSLAVAQSVRRQRNLGISASKLLGNLSVDVPVDSNVLKFTYSDASPRNAQIGADAFAHAYLALRDTQLQNQVRQSQAMALETSLRTQAQSLGEELSSLRASVVGFSGGGAALRDRIDGLKSQIRQLQGQLSAFGSAAGAVSGGSVLGRAALPGSPTQPKVVSYTIIGFILGLLLGFGVAAVLEQLDDRLRNPADVRAALGAPVLGVIPQVEGTGGARGRLW